MLYVTGCLGHAHTSVTLDIHTHALPKSDLNTSEALEGILENPLEISLSVAKSVAKADFNGFLKNMKRPCNH